MIFCIIFIKISYKRRSRLQDLSEGRRGFGRLSINVLWAWLRQQSGRRAASMWLQVLLVLLRPLQNLRPQSRDQPMSLATLPLRSLSLTYLPVLFYQQQQAVKWFWRKVASQGVPPPKNAPPPGGPRPRRIHTGTSAGFWLGGQCPLAAWTEENFENLTTK